MNRVRPAAFALALAQAFACAPALANAPAPPTPLPRPFGRGYAYRHPTEFAPYSFEKTLVRVRFDIDRGIVYGDEIAVVRPKRGGLVALSFHSLGIHYQSVRVNGRAVTCSFDDRKQLVEVPLATPPAAGARLAVEFTYWAQPQRGIYFVRPDKGYPNIAPEIWSQGETTDNRRWFPTWDEPNEKTPSELIVTVRHGWTVVANGVLRAHTRRGSTETWDWDAPRPKSTYLIAFAAGPLVKHHTTLGQARDGEVARYGNGSLDVDSFVQPQYARLNTICFGRTNEMVAYFQRIIGVRWPWEKYDQTTAERFIYGGMEDSSATIQTDQALHPASEDVEDSCDELVAHELAQEWFGDDVTMSDWSNAWINEGFATYFHELWGEHDRGEPAFEYDRYRAQQRYFAETRQYYRPIVDYVYTDGLELFDASGHQRPAQVLHMLRHMFGDARFFAALHAYLIRYEDKNANTHQFFVAIGQYLGTDLTWFENEWFYRAAYPHYYVTDRYDAATKTLTLDVAQKNHDGLPFRMPVDIEVVVQGRSRLIHATIDRNQQAVRITGIGARPQMVLFDPDNDVLRELTFAKPEDELVYQLARAPQVGDREWALHQLSQFATTSRARRTGAANAVREAVLSDPCYGVRADAVAVAGTFGDAATVTMALRDEDQRVRIAAEEAAGAMSDAPARTVAALYVVSNDADPEVAAAALAALGSLKAPGAYETLVTALGRPSFRQTIARGALRGLAAYGDVRAYTLVRARTAYGTQEQERDEAIAALAALAKRTGKAQAALPLFVAIALRDPLIAGRIAAIDALDSLGEAAAIPVLRRIERSDAQLLVQIEAWNATMDIRDAVHARRGIS